MSLVERSSAIAYNEQQQERKKTRKLNTLNALALV